MPIQQFTTYDLIVDTLPGAFLLLLLIPLLPKEAINTIAGAAAAAGVVMVGAGYVIGRLIHTAGPGFEDMDIPRRSTAEDNLIWFVIMELTDQMVTAPSNWGDERKYDAQLDILDNKSEELISYGQSILYSKNTLYSRYEMLSTFFRNLYYTFVLLSLVYLLRGLGGWVFVRYSISVPNLSTALPWWSYIVAIPLGLFLAIISKKGWAIFYERKSRAFFHDLHQYLDLHDADPPEEYLLEK